MSDAELLHYLQGVRDALLCQAGDRAMDRKYRRLCHHMLNAQQEVAESIAIVKGLSTPVQEVRA